MRHRLILLKRQSSGHKERKKETKRQESMNDCVVNEGKA